MDNHEFQHEVLRSLGRIEQKMDSHMEEDKAIHARQDAALNILFSKANQTERFQARTKGVVKGASLVSTILAGGLGLWLRLKGHI